MEITVVQEDITILLNKHNPVPSVNAHRDLPSEFQSRIKPGD